MLLRLSFWIIIPVVFTPLAAQDEILEEGENVISDFFGRYNATREVDLVFVLDRSGSVPSTGWNSMIRFVRDLLEHFTVDKDNTRVAIVTFGNSASVDINDLEPGLQSDQENKCTLNVRIDEYVKKKKPSGYTATYDALSKVHDLLLNSRRNSKKAVLVLTDGHSNIGPPPVKMAFQILSLKWNQTWNEDILGPQVEMYAFGIEDAYMPELRSMSSRLPQHVFLIPSFNLFQHLARRLHGVYRSVFHKDQQKEGWIDARREFCGDKCTSRYSECKCSSRTGEYACVCGAGYEMNGYQCEACPRGYFKPTAVPETCEMCPENTTTSLPATGSSEQCRLKRGYRVCRPLPDIEHGTKFAVVGNRQDEVDNTGVPCDGVNDLNSCHYQCAEGYRLTGFPVLYCNEDGKWVGTVPNCSIVDCGRVGEIYSGVQDLDVQYLNGTTTYGSVAVASCRNRRVPIGSTTWRCDKHGKWTKPYHFECAEVYCPVFETKRFMTISPKVCLTKKNAPGQECHVGCKRGFQVEGPATYACAFDKRALWTPANTSQCVDREKPVIECPPMVNVPVSRWSDNFTYVHLTPPEISDNSGKVSYNILNTPLNSRFYVGYTTVTYEAYDEAGNTKRCDAIVHVESKNVEVTFCPKDLTVPMDGFDGATVTWPDPEFRGPGNATLPFTCTPPSNRRLPAGEQNVTCHPQQHPSTQCLFTITVKEPECNDPYPDRKPRHGSLSCLDPDLYYKVCRIHCETGYEVRYQQVDHQYICTWDDKWYRKSSKKREPLKKHWPDCSRMRRGSSALMVNEIHVRYDGPCEEKKEEIKEQFMTSIKTILGEQDLCKSGDCSLDQVEVQCGLRQRRHAEQVVLGTSRDRRRLTRDVSNVNSTSNVRIILTFQTKLLNLSNVEFENQQKLLYDLDDIDVRLETAVNGGEIIFNISQNEAEAVSYEVTAPGYINITCSIEEVRWEKDYVIDCHTCPVGTYMVNNTCLDCGLGYYQDQPGQHNCTKCPDGTTTSVEYARDISECREPCQPGFYSNTGLSECLPCPTGTYQSESGSTACLTCAVNESTSDVAQTNQSACTAMCGVGHYSATGVDPCFPCPLQTYQLTIGATKCTPCGDTLTNSFCPPIFHCPEEMNCTFGNCVKYDEDIFCACHKGYTGEHCEIDIDECAEVTCLNNATCRDGINNYTCVCPAGLTGANCDVEIDNCLNNPCQNDGYCLNQQNGYRCICANGFSGFDCDVNVDECQSNPCIHGTCQDATNGYLCYCEQGYTGISCELVWDFCANSTCENGGSCQINEDGLYHCDCLPGFTGQYCEIQVTPCDSNPCQNNGTCFEDTGSYICRCMPGYLDKHCSTYLSPEFDLMFDGSSINDYVLYRYLPRLRELSVCLWLRTTDVSHYGTMLSYAVDSNWLSADGSNAFTLYDYGALQVFVNGFSVQTPVALNDGNWQHLCVLWQSEGGDWSVYVNGTMLASGDSLAKDTYVEEGGYLVLGQEQDSLGGRFSRRESFIGDLSQLNIYNYILNQTEIDDLAEDGDGRCTVARGGVVSWTDFFQGIRGDVRVRNISKCLEPNECLYAECGDHFTCVDLVDGFRCEPSVSPCTPSPCLNGGTCLEPAHFDGHICQCPSKYTGVRCEVPVNDPCHGIFCRNHHTCINVGGEHKCVCLYAGMGPLCDAEGQKCSQNVCNNDGLCLQIAKNKTCYCKNGYDGKTCDQKRDLCKENPCLHGAQCVVTEWSPGYHCKCVGPWAGEKCDIYYQPTCEQSPCLNNGTCVLSPNNSRGYKCQCPKPKDDLIVIYGPNCEPVTACNSGPCLHNGTCISLNKVEYECICRTNYGGRVCEISPDKETTAETPTSAPPSLPSMVENMCRQVECQNGGTCKNLKRGFVCSCTADFKGQYCEIKRKKEVRRYHSQVTLLREYKAALAYSTKFKKSFTNQIHTIYHELTIDGKLHVEILNIWKGSTVVKFQMDHTVYQDTTAPGQVAMRQALVDALQTGKLGDLDASMENFEFKMYDDAETKSDAESDATWIAILISVLVVVIVVIVLLVVFICKRRRRAALSWKPNNLPSAYQLQKINNPVFDPAPESPAIIGRSVDEEELYDEIPSPYAVTPYAESDNKKNLNKESELGKRFPSKNGRDINKEWAQKQEMPLPPTPPPPQGYKLKQEPEEYLSPRKLINSTASEDNININRRSTPSPRPPSSHDNRLDQPENYILPDDHTPPPSYREICVEEAREKRASKAPQNIDNATYFDPISDDEAAKLLETKKPETEPASPSKLPLATKSSTSDGAVAAENAYYFNPISDEESARLESEKEAESKAAEAEVENVSSTDDCYMVPSSSPDEVSVRSSTVQRREREQCADDYSNRPQP